MPLPAGTRLGRYEILAQIGAGGMENTTAHAGVETHNLSLSPDGTRVAFVAASEGQTRLFVRAHVAPCVRLVLKNIAAYKSSGCASKPLQLPRSFA